MKCFSEGPHHRMEGYSFGAIIVLLLSWFRSCSHTEEMAHSSGVHSNQDRATEWIVTSQLFALKHPIYAMIIKILKNQHVIIIITSSFSVYHVSIVWLPTVKKINFFYD